MAFMNVTSSMKFGQLITICSKTMDTQPAQTHTYSTDTHSQHRHTQPAQTNTDSTDKHRQHGHTQTAQHTQPAHTHTHTHPE